MLKQRGNGSAPLQARLEPLAEVLKALDELEHDRKRWKLTGPQYARQAAVFGRRWKELEAALASGEPGLEDIRQALRVFEKAIRGPNHPGPSSEVRRIRYLFGSRAQDELAARNVTMFDLQALAAKNAAERWPEDFGTAEDLQAVERLHKELIARRDALNAELATAFGAEDMLIEDLDAQGRARVSFKLSGGKVPIYPKENAGERLVRWMQRTP